MPTICHETFVEAFVDIDEFHDKGTRRLVAGDSYRGAQSANASLEIYVNPSNWSLCTPFEGVRLKLGGVVQGCRDVKEYGVSIESVLPWQEVKRLHGFLEYLLSQADELRMSAEDAEAARENPD